MEHIFCRKVIAGRDFRLPGRLFMALLRHDLMAAQPELHAAECMDAVIDTGVAGLPAAFHPAVGGIDNGIDFQCCDVASPDNKPGIRC